VRSQWGCSLRHMGLQPSTRRVAACAALARVAGLGYRDVDDAAQPGYGVLLVHHIGHVEPPHAIGHVRLVVRSKRMVGAWSVHAWPSVHGQTRSVHSRSASSSEPCTDYSCYNYYTYCITADYGYACYAPAAWTPAPGCHRPRSPSRAHTRPASHRAAAHAALAPVVR